MLAQSSGLGCLALPPGQRTAHAIAGANGDGGGPRVEAAARRRGGADEDRRFLCAGGFRGDAVFPFTRRCGSDRGRKTPATATGRCFTAPCRSRREMPLRIGIVFFTLQVRERQLRVYQVDEAMRQVAGRQVAAWLHWPG